MTICIDIQVASSSQDVPSESDIDDWIRETLTQSGCDRAGVTVRVVDEAEITSLNHRFRQQNKATDVLSFPLNPPGGVDTSLLGDVVVCADVINQQADRYHTDRQAHWARIVAHGILHLTGYDHDQPQAALKMESAEGAILERLGLHHPELHERAS